MAGKYVIFSIIVPVYKIKREYLEQCIDSILSQSFRDFELILIDDGSPDHCGSLCDAYSEKDSRVRVLHQKNQGVSAARNAGIEMAKGDWVWFVDGDDWIEQDALSILYRYLSESSDYSILQFRAFLEFANNSLVLDSGLQYGHLYDLQLPKEREFLYQRVIGISAEGEQYAAPAYYIWDKVFRRRFLLENNLAYPVGIIKSEDKIFIGCCYEKADKIKCVSDFLYHYRQNEQSVCHRYSANLDKNRIAFADALLPIVKRMDAELAKCFNDPTYHKIRDKYTRFLFAAVTDVLLLQFYHKDNPFYHNRRKDALKFLHTEPFRSVIRGISYTELSTVSKIKKLLLRWNFVSTFCTFYKYLRK